MQHHAVHRFLGQSLRKLMEEQLGVGTVPPTSIGDLRSLHQNLIAKERPKAESDQRELPSMSSTI